MLFFSRIFSVSPARTRSVGPGDLPGEPGTLKPSRWSSPLRPVRSFGMLTWPNSSVTLNVHVPDVQLHTSDWPDEAFRTSSHEYSSGSLNSMPLQVPRSWIRRMSMLRIRTLSRGTITAACRLGKHGQPDRSAIRVERDSCASERERREVFLCWAP